MGKSKASVLCVDDDNRILNALVMLLENHYDVLTTTNPLEAIEILKTQSIAIIISDQRMPEMLGIELLDTAKTISPSTIRILLTGFSDMDAVIHSVNESEVYRFIAKPWANDTLLNTLQEAIEAHHVLAEQHLNMTEQLPLSEDNTDDSEVYVIYKCEDIAEISALEQLALKKIKLLPAKSTEDVIQLLARYPVALLITQITQEDFELLRVLKKELPHLLTITIVSSVDYSEIISMINEIKIYRYIIAPAKTSKINFFMNSALKLSQQFKQYPALVKSQKVDNPLNNSETYPANLFNKIRSFFDA